MTPADVLDQLKTQLQGYSGLSYVDDTFIMLGVRESIPIFPCIIIEPINMVERDYAYPKQRITIKIAIIGYIKVLDKDKQFTGDANIKGILDLENDVKLALDSDRTLSGKCNDLSITDSSYEFVEYPIRSFTLNIEVLIEQTKSTR